MQNTEERISFESLSQMTGFSVDLIKSELLANEPELDTEEGLKLDELRGLMVKLVNSSLLSED